MPRDGFGRLLLLHVAALCTAGAVAAAAVLRRRHRRKMKALLPAPAMAEMPKVVMADDGHVEHIEKFSHYVARQMGFEEVNECPQLCKVANNYLRKTKNCMDDIYDLLANAPDAESLYVKLVEELDKCILGYFAFHWDLCTTLISQALTVDSATKKKLRNLVLEATRRPSPPAAVRWWRRSRPDLGPLGPNRRRIHGFGQAIVGAPCRLILLW